MIMYKDSGNTRYLWSKEYVMVNNSRNIHTYEEIDTSNYFSITREINSKGNISIKHILEPLLAYYSKDKYFFKSEVDYILWKLKYGL